ncbi:MAG: VCBS repeat-containing protein [Deltaproteobacteria bacterium]|nr:VCBS repeat-containing protein [Deltaproteobacteria bacterium]
MRSAVPARFTLISRTAALWLAWACPVQAQTGVSDDRVSLPDGPGSLEGIGENVAVDANMGQLRHSVAIKVPQGYAGMTPSLSLSYSSGAGASVAGLGWNLSLGFMERMTARGLPEYDLDDEFVVNGSEQLVRIPSTTPPVYRARFESGFVRYTWLDAGAGDEGYWRAEFPDGRISYYGADATGTLVPAARVVGAAGTFRYHLVETVDRYGHAIQYTYNLFGNVTLPVRVAWVFVAGSPVHEVTFAYEDRTDLVSDCKPGFNELLTKRLSRINVLSHGTRTHHYVLGYEDYATSGGFSRLSSVQLYGRDGGAYPVHETFTYSRGLGVQCQAGAGCRQAYTVDMGSIGANLQSGDATLIDINGDALPDIVDTSESGQAHRFFINRLHADGTHDFEAPFYSTVGTQASHDLSSPYVQVMDVNGDGRTDMVNSQTGQVLKNLGGGDWAEAYSLWSSGTGGVPDLAGDFDPTDGQLRTVRFLDYDNDKRIDLIRSENPGVSNITTVFRNMGNGGFQSDSGVENTQMGFEENSVELNDINGDGLLDIVRVTQTQVEFRLNLGWGHWAPVDTMTGLDLVSAQEAIDAELEDINGDSLSDLVLVKGNEVHYWLNRNGDAFDPKRVVTSADVDGDVPVRTSATVVLYADMNGNGSSDIVWIESGHVQYLELFPDRPNLVVRVENGLGKTSAVTYGTSVMHLARAGGAGSWQYALPSPMQVVDEFDEWDAIGQVHDITRYTYADGYYDGVEKAFRGFARVEQREPASAESEEGRGQVTYDVGATDVYRNGLVLTQTMMGAADRVIQVSENTYADCTVAGVPSTGLLFPVRHVCKTRERTELREGRPAGEWVVVEKRFAYDGYGNTVLQAQLGVTSVGGGACAACTTVGTFGKPCGPQCLGDEHYTRTTYTAPENNADRWILSRAVSVKTFGTADGSDQPADDQYGETVSYYDGPDFTGLPAGLATHGTLMRVTARAGVNGEVAVTARNKLDAHGNVIETLDALGVPDGNTHRRVYTMDAEGLRVVRIEVLLENAGGPYRLRRDAAYSPLFGLMTEGSEWQVVKNGVPEGTQHKTFYSYDEFARRTSTTRPEEEPGFATEEYTWEPGNPSSRVIERSRSVAGGALDSEEITCFDGQGRTFQQRQRIAANEYRVSGFTVVDAKGNPVRTYQPYMGTSGACDATPPNGVGFVAARFDAMSRVVEETYPAVASDGADPPVRRFEYRPLVETAYDLEDTSTTSAHKDTPTTRTRNGLGRLVSEETRLTAGGTPLTRTFTYDDDGNIATVTDADGAVTTQRYDLQGRLVESHSADRGTTTWEFDAAGNTIRTTGATGTVQRVTRDGANRILAEWDESDETGTRIGYFYDMAGECPAAQCAHAAGLLAYVRFPLDDGTTGEERNGYNPRGRVTYLGRLMDGHLLELRSQYDNVGRIRTEVYPDGRQVDYAYNGDDKVTAIAGVLDNVTYAPSGAIDQMSLANGVTVTYARDARNRLQGLTAVNANSQALLSFTYGLDRAGNILSVTDGHSPSGAPSANATYQYDALYRLVQAHLDPGNGAHEETLAHAYSPGGNIISTTSSLGAQSKAHVGTLSYGENGAGPHAVTTAGSMALGYDDAGRLVTRGDRHLTWDHQNRATSVTDERGRVTRYVYGYTGERIIKREDGHTTYYLTPQFEVRDGVATSYVVVDDRRVARMEDPSFAAVIFSDIAPATGPDTGITAAPDQVITAADGWVAQAVGAHLLAFATATRTSTVDQLLEASVRRLVDGDAERSAYLLLDHQGSTAAVTDETGQVTERYAYYPFGLLRHASGDGEDYGYTGKETDEDAGLAYFGARYYDGWTGRWTSPDPRYSRLAPKAPDEGDETTAAYRFVRNNPVNAVDPDGQFAVEASLAIAGAVALHSVSGAIIGGIAGALSSMFMGSKTYFDNCKTAELEVEDMGVWIEIFKAKTMVAVTAGVISGIVGGPIGGIVGGVVAAKVNQKRLGNLLKANEWLKDGQTSFLQEHASKYGDHDKEYNARTKAVGRWLGIGLLGAKKGAVKLWKMHGLKIKPPPDKKEIARTQARLEREMAKADADWDREHGIVRGGGKEAKSSGKDK